MRALIIGGSGAVSTHMARAAMEHYEVWTLTRGKRGTLEGVHTITADRNDEEAFENAILSAGTTWDVVFDCICLNERHAAQDLRVLSKVTTRLVCISTDSVFDPNNKRTPQSEEGLFIEESGAPEECSYGGNKRKMEHVFLSEMEKGENASLDITLFRPGHIYGPGFLLGCYPAYCRSKELPEKILNGEEIELVAAGIYLIQPIFVGDLVRVMLECVDNYKTFGQIFCIGGPKAIENRHYFELLARLLKRELKVKEIPLTGYADAHPGDDIYLCHRIYDLSKLAATGIPLPSTTLEEGLRLQLEALGY